MDTIVIAQAFHWFDNELSKVEYKRILKENGYVIFLWNDMLIDNEFFNRLYKY
ncbi:hypothetical protein EJF36_06740 [Bacillus sp. HMF5848]|nr:hypothetical protein EJF36_06740 [Bacillus sp. HMF5848]